MPDDDVEYVVTKRVICLHYTFSLIGKVVTPFRIKKIMNRKEIIKCLSRLKKLKGGTVVQFFHNTLTMDLPKIESFKTSPAIIYNFQNNWFF